LWICATPYVADWLARSVETFPSLDRSTQYKDAAIVVLGAGIDRNAREYGGRDSPAADTLERMRYGATLARESGLPLAVSGGTVFDANATPLGELMAAVLESDFKVEVSWIESESANTAQNAAKLRNVLPLERVILVTHAMHMRRAAAAFENVGFTVIPAPMAFSTGIETRYDLFACLPTVGALATSRAVIHEWLGSAYYALRY
jgi:uncharacterized SAM-binding protein YcdF (DUF218 family)